MSERRVIAIDLGASSVRVIDVRLGDGPPQLIELHRAPNAPVERIVGDTRRWCWDVDAISAAILAGLRRAADGPVVQSIGIDGWAVDYALIDAGGTLVAPVTAYRDGRHEPAMERVRAAIGDEQLYGATGIQFQPFNTIYQLAADASDPDRPLDRAKHLLLLPDYIAFLLGGATTSEATNASTTQLFDTETGAWIDALVDAIGVSPALLPRVVPAADATPIGRLRPEIAASTGLPADTPIMAVGTHDTASAVLAAPISGPGDAYLSSGTWSLLGVERSAPIRTPDALAANLTNEGGVFGTTRLLRNITGLWLLQECRREWQAAGSDLEWSTLIEDAAAETRFGALIDPDDPLFATPGPMTERIRSACRANGEPDPRTPAAITRTIIDSLALRCAQALDCIANVTQSSIERLTVVGGGANNMLLNETIAAATDRPVVIGPTEATALGNALAQEAAAAGVTHAAELRSNIPITHTIKPRVTDAVTAGRQRFDHLYPIETTA